MDDRFIRKIITYDEKWVHYRNPDASNEWLCPRQPAKVIVKINQFSSKVKMCVWRNFESVILWEIVPNGCAADADLYSQQVEQLYEIFRSIYPALFNRNRVLLQQDNTRLHIARTTMTKIWELRGIGLLPHPHTALILCLQITICSDPWPISCVKEI